jgi:hypothetical protein
MREIMIYNHVGNCWKIEELRNEEVWSKERDREEKKEVKQEKN